MNSKRYLELDALRGVAVIIVLLFHYTFKYNEVFQTSLMSFFEFKYGHYEVHLFFIISGYVILLTLSKVKSGVEFVLKRFIRLYPTFWLCLTFTFAFTFLISNLPRFQRSWEDFLVNFTMVPSLFGVRMVDGVYWSLLYELEFYFIMFLIYKMKLLNKIELVSCLWLILSFFLVEFFDNSKLKILLISDYAFLFIAGINFYKLQNKKNIVNHILIALCFVFIFLTGELEEVFFTGLFFTIFYLVVYKKMTFLNNLKILIFLGYISYPLYLIHQFFGLSIINKLNHLGLNNYFLLLLIPTLLSVFFSWLIINKFEEKLINPLKLKIKKIYY